MRPRPALVVYSIPKRKNVILGWKRVCSLANVTHEEIYRRAPAENFSSWPIEYPTAGILLWDGPIPPIITCITEVLSELGWDIYKSENVIRRTKRSERNDDKLMTGSSNRADPASSTRTDKLGFSAIRAAIVNPVV